MGTTLAKRPGLGSSVVSLDNLGRVGGAVIDRGMITMDVGRGGAPGMMRGGGGGGGEKELMSINEARTAKLQVLFEFLGAGRLAAAAAGEAMMDDGNQGPGVHLSRRIV